jgi:methyl-accepting chemotaxis protein
MIEAFKEEANKSLKDKQENTIKQVKEINKIVPNLKAEIKAIKKAQTEGTLEMDNLGKRTKTTDASITQRIQEMEERISGVEDRIEEIDISVNENVKAKNFLTQNIQRIWDTMQRPNLRTTGTEEGEESQLQGQKIFSTKS